MTVNLRNPYCWEHADALVDTRINADHAHVWPFVSDSFPVDVRYLIVDRRQEVPMHRPDHLEVVILESGQIGYEMEGRSCILRANDVLFAGDRIRHRCLSLGQRQPEARAIVLSFQRSVLCPGVSDSDDSQYLAPFNCQDASFSNVISSETGVHRDVVDFMDRIH